ncbi:MAG: cyanoexosortase B [Xenococcaceae cyanobacterium MO_188.B32]|nr:cyanoexosortase B [Xenococcaceae cyanobacterium MO_188.B32]
MQIENQQINEINQNERKIFNFIIIALLTLLYAPIIIHWYDGWLNKSISIEHEYFSHGLIGFPFAAYICWLKRKQWRRLSEQAHPLGIVGLGIGSVLYLTGVPELVNLSFPLVLVGICLISKGMAGLKLQAFPFLLVLLATPNSLPYLITPFTLPLQKFIAGSAGFILMQFGLDVSVEQIYLAVGGRLVEVAPYCAGLKMLFTSLYVALMLLYWTDNLRDRTKTTTLLVGAVTISVIANILRNTILTFFHGTGRDGLFTWLHDGWGGDLYSTLMLGSIVLFLKFLENFDFTSEH